MQSPPPLNDWLRRPWRYWYVDGLSEMAVGVIFLLVGMTDLLALLLPPGPIQSLALAVLQPLVVIGGVLGVRPVVRYLKEHITYPRTGRVRYRQPTPSWRRLLAALSALLGMSLAAAIAWLGKAGGQRWLPLVSALIIAFVTAMGWRLHLVRMLVLAFYIFGVGVVLTIFAPASPLDAILFFGLVGLGWLLSGGWTLWRYLRQTQPPADSEGV